MNDFKNSLQSFGSAGIAVESPAEKFEGLEAFDGRAGEPIGNRVVRIGQTCYGKVGAVQPKLVVLLFACWVHRGLF